MIALKLRILFDAADKAFLEALSSDAADAKFTAQGFAILN